MNKDLTSYLKIYNAIDKDLCKSLIEKVDGNLWKEHVFYNSLENSYLNISGNQELEISVSEGKLEESLMQVFWKCLYQYVTELDFPWFVSWSGHSSVRFNRYTENKKMAEHCDHIHSLFDGERKGIPVISLLGILNDDFEGGELVFWEDVKINVKAGDVLVWPSCFLYPHRVEPVIKGTRYSCVSWAW